MILFLFPFTVEAQSFPEIGSQAAVAMDAATGTIVYTKNPDEEIPPASLTKLMTMHLTFREIEAGRASLDEVFTPSREAWGVNQPPLSSLMGIAAGHSVSLRDLLLGMAIFSGNDAATATALRFAPSLVTFTEIMTGEAASLGLGKTRFVDASGYSEDNMTTAREFAEFCRIYIEAHPYSLSDYHSVREFAYPRPENLPEQYRANPGTRLQRNRITLLGRVEGLDGLKTGFIFESGYNIALTAERDGTRFIVVILGGPSERIRDEDGEKLINWVFANYKTIKPDIGTIMPFRVWKGKANYVDVVPGEPLDFTALIERGENLDVAIEQEETLIAPIPAGSVVGNVVLYDTLGELRRIPLLTTEEAEKGGFFKRLFDSIRLFFRRIFSQ
ncbi:MAG: D-alanyl-D-alanine carboxypeptidase [Treponema sp.]|nr:D-alanyl-D-alanine carboxypeptidase [Treponema sp.]